MNPSYAAIFSVQSLELNQHYRTCAPLVITHVVKAPNISWQDGCLALPSEKLNSEQKKQLWSLIGEQLDKL